MEQRSLFADDCDELLERFQAFHGGVDWLAGAGCLRRFEYAMQARTSIRIRCPVFAISTGLPSSRRRRSRWCGCWHERRDELCWGQTYIGAEFGQGFLDNYGWLEVSVRAAISSMTKSRPGC